MAPDVVSHPNVARRLLSGELPPEDFACHVVPAPRVLRTTLVTQILEWLYSFTVLIAVAAGIMSVAAATLGRPARDALSLILIAGASVMLGRLFSAFTFGYRRVNAVVVRDEIDHDYRHSVQTQFLDRLREDIERHACVPDPVFIQSVVERIRAMLKQLNVPDPQVCILQVEGPGAYVSYYAGSELPDISRGTMITNVSTVGARRVVYDRKCTLDVGLEPRVHQVVIVAACNKLDESDKRVIKAATDLLSTACTRQHRVEALL